MNVDLYRSLFVHRCDVFAEQHADGSYAPVRRPLDDTDVAEHLAGFASYGVYVIDPEDTRQEVCTGHGDSEVIGHAHQTVAYVVFDLDTYDRDALDFLCRRVEWLLSGGQPVLPDGSPWGTDNRLCLLLEDSGGKGYHLWLFLSEPTSAAKVRAWTEPVRTAYAGMARTAVEPWPALEIFPKQDEVTPGAFGNLVKLPLGVHAKTKARSRWVLRPGWAKDETDVVRFPVSLIPPPAPAPERRSGDVGESTTPFACVSRILSEGAGKGQRDDAMYHFASYCFTHGLPEPLALEWAQLANEGFDPELSPSQVAKCVRSAYDRKKPVGCGADWLRDYCPGGAHCFAPWNDRGEQTDDNPYPVALSPEARRAWRQENAR